MTARIDIEALERRAADIPSMGGRQIGEFLRSAARDEAMPESAIVEAGCWLGAGTAQLALGLRDRADIDGITIHSFDLWKANDSEAVKAARAGIKIKEGQDTLPIVRKALTPFGVPISFHKGRIEEGPWNGCLPISVYVQDAGKDPYSFFPIIKKFGPFWIPEKTVIFLMDYYHWRKSGKEDHKCQTEFVESNSACFSKPVHLYGSAVMLRYLRTIDFSEISSGDKKP